MGSRIEQVDLGADKGVFLRLKAGPLTSAAQAASICDALAGEGAYCGGADFTGEALP